MKSGVPKWAWATVFVIISTVCWATVGRIEARREATRSQQVAAHAGHEQTHEAMMADLATAMPGDLIAMDGRDPLVFLHARGEPSVGTVGDGVQLYPPDMFPRAPIQQPLLSLIPLHPRVIRKGTPEYSEALTQYFVKKYYSR